MHLGLAFREVLGALGAELRAFGVALFLRHRMALVAFFGSVQRQHGATHAKDGEADEDIFA